MDILTIIGKKRDKQELNKQEINYFITEYTKGNIPDYQAAALIMAIYINGMKEREITDLTLAMADSGEKIDLSEIGAIMVDKHSTGGVGDKVTIVLLPIIASLGIPVAKMSGRGLGITGGTIDKLEAIPGYKTDLSVKKIIENTQTIGICLTGQTLDLAPADKKIYALRDAINCTANIPLIASSIMSKKIASGSHKIVIDATCGKGAFMKTKEEAVALSKMMVRIGKQVERETVCVLTNMDEPLGMAIGNSLEIIEAIEFLKGKSIPDLEEVVLELGSYMIKLAGKGENLSENKERIKEVIQNGKAFAKLFELVLNQGGDTSYIEDTTKFSKAKYILPVLADEEGSVQEIDAEKIGSVSVYLGAGRMRKEDKIDYEVGIVLNKKIGDMVKIGESLAFIHVNDEEKAQGAIENVKNAFRISEKKTMRPKMILGSIE
mgnify:CR=1 FL=1